MNEISREISEREVKLPVSAAPPSPVESDIERDIAYGATVVNIKAELDAERKAGEILMRLHREAVERCNDERKAHDETISDYGARVLELESALRQVQTLKVQVQSLIGVIAQLNGENVKLNGIIADARLAFGEINRRAQVLANTVDELRSMMAQ